MPTKKKHAIPVLEWNIRPYTGKIDLSNEVTVVSIHTAEATKGINYDGFFLNGVQFGWCTRGKMRIHRSDGEPIDVKKGQFAIIYGQRVTRVEALEARTVDVCVTLSGFGAMNFADEIGLYDGFVTQDVMPASSIRMLAEMVERHKKDGSVTNAVIMNLVSNILTSVVDRARILGKAQLLNAVRCFDDHFGQNDFSVGSVADELGISPNTLYLIFRDHGLVSPGAFAESRQLRRARAMLANSRIKVKEIARRCGFTSPAHFTVFIKKHFGHTPRELRNGNFDAAPQLGGGGGDGSISDELGVTNEGIVIPLVSKSLPSPQSLSFSLLHPSNPSNALTAQTAPRSPT